MRLRHQLAAYSPTNAASAFRAVLAAAGAGDPRATLTALLEREYAAAHAVLTGSGTEALQLAISTARAGGRPATAALPAFGCFDLIAAAVGADVQVVLYDLDPETLGPNLASFERALARGTGVAVVAPFYGVPVGWDAVAAIAEAHRVPLIEDAAQGHGASWRGRPIGSIGEISVLSFGRGKGWTGGSGGALLLRGAFANAVPAPPRPGIGGEAKTAAGLVAQWLMGRPAIYGVPRAIPALGLGVTTYHPPHPPLAIARAAAAAVLANRASSLDEAGVRRDAGGTLRAAVLENPHLRAVRPPRDSRPGFLRYPVRVDGGLRGFAAHERARRLGIEQSYPFPIAQLQATRSRILNPDDEFPGAAELARDLVTVPTHALLGDDERREIADLLRAV